MRKEVRFIAKDGKVFENEDETIAEIDCEEYEQFVLGINHGLLRIEPWEVKDPLDE